MPNIVLGNSQLAAVIKGMRRRRPISGVGSRSGRGYGLIDKRAAGEQTTFSYKFPPFPREKSSATSSAPISIRINQGRQRPTSARSEGY